MRLPPSKGSYSRNAAWIRPCWSTRSSATTTPFCSEPQRRHIDETYIGYFFQFADGLMVMDHGRIIEEGSPAELITRNVGGEVLEIEQEPGSDGRVVEVAGEAAEGHERTSDGFLLYGRDAEGLLRLVREAGLHFQRATVRRATLEDVFLRLTGRELKD